MSTTHHATPTHAPSSSTGTSTGGEPSSEEGESDKPPPPLTPSHLTPSHLTPPHLWSPESGAAPLNERVALEAVREGLKRGAQRPDLSDDCACVELSNPTQGLVITTDALVEGVHFERALDTPSQVGAQAAVANLSDLASSGAWPTALVWSLSLPPSLSASALSALSEGFARVCSRYQASVVGGNLCLREGPLELHVSAFGQPMSAQGRVGRSGARPGDRLYVSGALGARALGYLYPSAESRRLRHAWRPHLPEARALLEWGGVSAMMDVSDGLLLDASRLAEASGVGVELERERLPLDDAARALQLNEAPITSAQLTQAALSGGEDYVLLFCASSAPPPALGCVEVGRCVSQRGLWLDGAPHTPQGYLHGEHNAEYNIEYNAEHNAHTLAPLPSLSFQRSP